jgi:hypothetical protein
MTQFPGRKGPFPAHDPDAWREAREIFGQAEASSRLRIFLDDLARDRKILETTPPDRCVAREIGHRTAARAGILGFPALARASMPRARPGSPRPTSWPTSRRRTTRGRRRPIRPDTCG